MVFLEKKNIIRWKYLEKAAFDVGLDSARLRRDVDGKAKQLFRDDLMLAHELEVVGFPTLFFNDDSNNKHTLKGYKAYENFEEIILKLAPYALKEIINTSPYYLFSRFPTMTDKEFAYLSNITRPEAVEILIDLQFEGKLDKFESKNGVVWISKFVQ